MGSRSSIRCSSSEEIKSRSAGAAVRSLDRRRLRLLPHHPPGRSKQRGGRPVPLVADRAIRCQSRGSNRNRGGVATQVALRQIGSVDNLMRNLCESLRFFGAAGRGTPTPGNSCPLKPNQRRRRAPTPRGGDARRRRPRRPARTAATAIRPARTCLGGRTQIHSHCGDRCSEGNRNGFPSRRGEEDPESGWRRRRRELEAGAVRSRA